MGVGVRVEGEEGGGVGVAVVGGVSAIGEGPGDLDFVLVVGEGLVTGVLCCEPNPESLEDRFCGGEELSVTEPKQILTANPSN